VNLFEVAQLNGPIVLANYESSLSTSADKTAISAFASWVETQGRISINVGLFVIVRLLNGEPYQNTHEVAEELSSLSGRPSDDLLQERLKGFYALRMAFDKFFSEGRRFYYGALNAGGVGLSPYGEYCAILKWDAVESCEKIAYFPGDTRKICIGPEGTFADATTKLFVPHSHRHYMVAVKQASRISHTESSGWPYLVCGDECHFESIFVGRVMLENVDLIRIPHRLYETLFDMAFNAIGTSRTPAERALIYDFIQLRKAEKNGRIIVELL